jgi:hypothetical protein
MRFSFEERNPIFFRRGALADPKPPVDLPKADAQRTKLSGRERTARKRHRRAVRLNNGLGRACIYSYAVLL